MDVQKKLDEIVAVVGNARSMPMSASCVVNRAELLELLDEVREALPGSLAHAEELIGGREQLVEQARQEAERIVESAHAQRGSLISDTEIARRSRGEADRILSEARSEAAEVRAEADEYVDSKLANFEVVLTKTIGSVDRGREKLLGRSEGLDEQGYQDPDFAEAPERSADPETLRRRADDYVDAKFGAFEAVLAKTLEAVGRGRQKLHGSSAGDDLGAHMAAQDAAGAQGHTSDEDHWAGLAEPAAPDLRHTPQQPLYTDPGRPDYTGQAQPDYAEQGRADYASGTVPGYADPVAMPDFPPAQAQPDPQYGQMYAYQDQPLQPEADPYAAYQQQAQHDPYAAFPQQGYDPNQSQAQPQPQQEYDWQQQQQQQQQQPALPPAQPGAGALDETSLFDTSMIDLEQLRRYEQGR